MYEVNVMSYEIIVNCKNMKSKVLDYPILIYNSFDELPNALMQSVPDRDLSFCVVSDSHVSPLYSEKVISLLETCAKRVLLFEFEAGEQQKNLHTVEKLYSFLLEHQFGRKDMLIALGGGVTGDLTGYAAATYMRGIEFIQIPTTLLSQVDSSIGGKTGVDFDSYKNMVGAFKMPQLVYINTSVLSTLPDREYSSGMAEVMKSALIKDAVFYEWLIDHFNEINDQEPDIVSEMIHRTCLIKKNVVEKDPTEQGDRALLNLGHTLGHALEKYKNFSLTHGECVALGCIMAAYISWKKELLSMDEYYEIRDMFVPFDLPISIDDIVPEEIVALTASDKKMTDGTLKFILLKKIGKAVIHTDVNQDEMLAAVNEIFFQEEELYD
ncbi:MAG: 3-dehydroquinate synthase [bacterium]|nr:3-dehydroquinate synthase [bacterium]